MKLKPSVFDVANSNMDLHLSIKLGFLTSPTRQNWLGSSYSLFKGIPYVPNRFS